MLGGQAPPFTVVSTYSVLVSVEVTEAIINSIHPGQTVDVFITAASPTPFTGIVATVSPAANQMTSTFTIEVAVSNPQGIVRPGMFAEVFFIRAASENAIVVPRAAVTNEDGYQVVYIEQHSIAHRRIVETGIDTGTEIEILTGVNIGEMLIVVGQSFVTDGVNLIVVEAN
jgi:RND family efflux transporter MFP subunit